MDSHRDYSPLERPRLLENGSGGSGTGGSSGAGSGNLMPSISELAARAATPTTLTTLTQFHSRYGMSSAVPSPNLALMSSLFTGAHNSDTRKTLLPDIQHYWNAQTESFPRYLMTGGLYSPYTSLLPGTAESLSLFGAGVACVAGGAAPGVGPSQSHHIQRLFEMQKANLDLSREAYLVSMSANHHTHLYGIGTNTVSPFLDQTAVSSHSTAPLSLVKQEPRELSSAEKTCKQGEKRATSLKVDVDLNRDSRESTPFSTSGQSQSPQIKEPKLSPSSHATSRKSDKNSNNSSGTRLSNNNTKTTSALVTINSGSFPKPRPDSRSSRQTQPGSSAQSHKNSNNSNHTHSPGSKKTGSKSSVSKQLQIPASGCKASSMTSSSSLVESPVISVPTKAAAPIPLATVQHDGVLLSALASPTSAAASSISAKSSIFKQHAERLNRTSTTVKSPMGAEKVASLSNTGTFIGLSGRRIDITQNCDHNTLDNHSNSDRRKDTGSSSITSNTNGIDKCSHREDSILFSDDSSDIVVDSTENDDVPTSAELSALRKSEHERAVEETIERVASATTDSDVESDQDDVYSQSCGETKSSSTSVPWVPNLGSSSGVTTTGSSTNTRTVYAKTQPVLSVAVSGNIPVGIAVAQIRPQYIHQQKEPQTPENLSRDTRQRHTAASSKTMTTATASLVTPAPSLAPSLVVTGPTVNQSPWLPQMSFPLPQAMNPSATTFDPSFPITAPSGFKIAHDSLSGRLFLIPTEDFVEQGGVWPTPSFVQPTTTLNLPTITVSGGEKREGRPNTEGGTDKNVPSANTSDKIIPVPETISKEKLAMSIDDGKHRILTQPLIGSDSTSYQGLAAATTVVVNPVTNGSSNSPAVLVKVEQPTFESRGCSPIIFEDVPSPLSILSALSCLTSGKPTLCTVGVQTCESLMRSTRQRKSSPQKGLLRDQGVQTLSPDFPTLNPLSVQCPDLDLVCPLTNSLEDKTDPEHVSYNPFTDPQILQAADGLELLSTLAEKRPKCSSIDDPKRIFPSPSDSFKSDSASLVAAEDTLSPGEMDLKSGQCTPRREVWRDLSPKWSQPKKEPPTLSALGDFKAPSEVEAHDDSEMRVKLAEVQRQYKEKQKELAKLQTKKTEESKQSKRGPGRPPKNRTPSKKSDDESSSSSSKTKDQPPQKKKRPAEELVDRVFRKLPPVIKPIKGSRSIHYVKSKTGPFFRRKSASSSVKRNKDLFGFDESTWPSFSERKHQEKVKSNASINGKSKTRHRSSSSHSEDSKHSQDAGNIFSNLESFGGDYVEKTSQSQETSHLQENIERRSHQSKPHSHKLEKLPPSVSGSVVIKTEICSTSTHQETGLGLLAKFALNSSTTPVSSFSTTAISTKNTSVTFSSTSTVNSLSSSPFSNTNITNNGNGLYNSSSTKCDGHSPGTTFGSMSSFMTSTTSSLISFNSPVLAVSSATSAATSVSTMPTTTASLTTPLSSTTTPKTSTTASTSMVKSQFASSETQPTNTEESSTGWTSNTVSDSETGTNNTINVTVNSTSDFSRTNISPLNIFTSYSRDTSPNKRKFEEDSDTDASDTSINKKRKPGRPRKMNPEKSSCATETIWAKKSTSVGLLRAPEPSSSLSKDGDGKKMDPSIMKPLFLDEEWTRRRSERIFLSEPSPQPSPAISPTPRGEPVWKLSNFMPKSKKLLDVNKSTKESEKDKVGETLVKDQLTSSIVAQAKTSPSSASSKVTVKTEGKESILWTSSNKAAEIPTLKVEDAKKNIKMEDEAQSLMLPLSEKAKKNSRIEDSEKKKKVKKSITKTEAPPTLSLSPPTLEMKVRRAEENSKIKLQKAKSLHDLTQRVKKKFSKAGRKKQEDNQLKSTSKSRKMKRKISTDSSDTDNLPLVSLRAHPPTPEPRTCRLQQSDLREGLKVLYLVDGLFHEGTVKALQPPDVYGVLTAGQRGNRPHILCLEEILKWAVLDVKPGSLRYLPEGTRVCAFWSQQFSCLYPGTVAKSSTISNNGKKVVVPVEFDDGDNGRIELDHIRLLPSDFPIVEYEPDPLEALPKRKQRSTSDASERRKSMDTTDSKSSKQTKENMDIDDDDKSGSSEEDEKSNENIGNVARKLWKWEGKSTKKPGLKGKAKKVFYKAISRGKETIKVGDSAIFVSKERVNCPYIGHIENLWEGWNGQMMVRVQWYYHPEETESDKKLSDPRNALFESQHEDENDVQTIAHKCDVLSYAQYKKRMNNVSKKGRSLKSNVFYVAGFYDPTAKEITFQSGVS